MDHIENYESNNSSIVACVFVATVTLLPSHCLATVGGNTYRWEGFMKYVIEMGSSAMMYIPSFIKICSDIQKLMRGRG
jgi:hypothetical protein